jgi:LPXTG-motif cell wall-anchored protein
MVSKSAAPAQQLPYTGTDITGVLMLGAAIIAAGAVTLRYGKVRAQLADPEAKY